MSIDKKIIEIAATITGIAFIGMSLFARRKKLSSIYENDKEQKNPYEGKKVVLIEDENDKENTDGVKGHLEAVGDSNYNPEFYENYIKKGIDIALSFVCLVDLFSLFAIIALAIKMEDPGPVYLRRRELVRVRCTFNYINFVP